MSVVEEIQNQQLAGPNARAFDPKAWLERGVKSGCSDEDLLIIAIGMLFSSGLDELRKRLSFISRKAVPSGLKQLSFISLCNRECLLAEVIAGESVDQINVDKVVSIDKLALQQMEIAGGRYLPSEICETAVDISTALLRMCPAATAETLASLSDQPWDEIARDFRVANAYVCIEDLWMSVVWNGVRLMKRSPFVFAPKNEEAERIRVVSEHRYLLTIVQRFNIRFLNMKRAFDSGELAPTPINQLVARIENDGEVAISAALAGNDFAAYSATVKSLVPNYYRKMAMDGAPEDCDLSLMLVVDAYLLLMGLAQSIAQPAIQELKRERKEDDYQASWAKLAPSIPAPALIEAIEGGLNIPKLLAEKLIKFLTFRGMGKKADNAPLDELWSSPFVQTSEETFALCVHPLLHPNFQWLIDVWLKRLGFPLDFRGNEFEQFARSSIALRVVNSSLKSSSQICTSSFEFTPTGGREEEIDLLMVLGDKVVVGEIKCFLQPVSPVDRKNHRTKVFDAAKQVARKAEAIRTAKSDFRARASHYDISIPEEFEVLPVVVLNHALGAGDVIENVPIVDLRIVEMFFEGSMEWMVQVSPNGDVASGQKEPFYQSSADAIQTIGEYLKDPPQIRHLKNSIKPRITALIFPGAKDDTAYRLQLQIDPDSLPTC